MRLVLGLVVASIVTSVTVSADAPTPRMLSVDDRVAAQRAIEQVYWNHRIWPKENPTPKPALSAVMPDGAIRDRVDDYLKKSNVLDREWRRPITGEQLQRELDRIARDSNDRRMLRELFDALGNDPFVIAETLARPVLADRLARNWYAADTTLRDAGDSETFDAWWNRRRAAFSADPSPASGVYVLPVVDSQSCRRDTWSLTHADVPEARTEHFAVWTGSEMIVWGGFGITGYRVTGGRYDPATDTWTAMSLQGDVPIRHRYGSVVWTGKEMIVWGGWTLNSTTSNTGARYNPATDTWHATSVGANVPQGRNSHTAVWTGSEMIVWGGQTTDPGGMTGGRYNPVSDSWLPTSIGPDTPAPRVAHTAVWTGSEMIIWGGRVTSGASPTGARYNPSSDIWLPIAASGAPSWRNGHTAVWTGTEMIVWGGVVVNGPANNTGGRYRPANDSWLSTSTLNAPSGGSGYFAVWTGSRMLAWNGAGAAYDPSANTWNRMAAAPHPAASGRTVVWTGEDMIDWGGSDVFGYLNSGARYRPGTDSWVPTANASTVPSPRFWAPSIWTGAELIVWGGNPVTSLGTTNTGGRYSPATDSWLPTSLAPEVPSARIRHTAVWTGREMIVWGGTNNPTGGRYDPMTDTWRATSTGTNVPPGRASHTAVWTGTEMIVWGGYPAGPCGGRYDPVSDAWRPISTDNAPFCASSSAAVWTDNEMIVWGGFSTAAGGRYDPKSDTWNATSMVNAPSARYDFAAVWTGHEMIVWGGHGSASGVTLNSGGQYDPVTDTWSATSLGANVPPPCDTPVAVWTGLEMVVFHPCGPDNNQSSVGARYDPASNAWLPMSSWPLSTSYLHHGSAVWTGDHMLIWVGPATDAGASYCGCPRLQTVYRDADGDGFGDAATSLTTCDDPAPAGYAEDHTDCDDANAAIHAGAVETCDGVDDNCDGAIDEGGALLCDDGNPCTVGEVCGGGSCHPGTVVPPADVEGMLVSEGGGKLLTWTAVPGSAAYDIVSSTISDLHIHGVTTAHCLWDDVRGTSYGDEQAEPVLGDGYYYLIRAQDACGVGSYGVDSTGAERNPASACP